MRRDVAVWWAWSRSASGPLRQYLSKGCDMRDLTQERCHQIAERLNTRPRATLQWQTPAQALDRVLIAAAA
jgi:IS30 family transposase